MRSLDSNGVARLWLPADVPLRPSFRARRLWSFFRFVDRSHAFLCGGGLGPGPHEEVSSRHSRAGAPPPWRCRFSHNAIGDADFRSLAVALTLQPKNVHQLSTKEASYYHPLPWCFTGRPPPLMLQGSDRQGGFRVEVATCPGRRHVPYIVERLGEPRRDLFEVVREHLEHLECSQ